MWEVKANYERKGLGNRFPMCQSEEDTTEHVLEFNKGDKKFKLNEEREGKNGERQQKSIERTRRADQQTIQEKSEIYQKNRRKEKTAEEDKC